MLARGGGGGGGASAHLLDFGLQVPQLDALLQVAAVLLGRQVQLLLLLVEELQQVLHPRGHVHVAVAQQLHACTQREGRGGAGVRSWVVVMDT